eukprot:253380_1
MMSKPSSKYNRNVMLIQGWYGGLNLPVFLDNISNAEIELLQKCKKYIEKDLFAPATARWFDMDQKHHHFDKMQHYVEQLLTINENKSEYHYLYAMIIQMQSVNQYDCINGESLKLSSKHFKTAYTLNNQHPTYILHRATALELAHNDENWYHDMEANLNNSDYRNKYNSIIDEVECSFIHHYHKHLLDQIDTRNGDGYIRNHYCFNSLNRYFNKYLSILKKLNMHPMIKHEKHLNYDVYLFVFNHLEYCKNFAIEFRMFGQIKKALKAMNTFIKKFDNKVLCLIDADTKPYLLIIDCLMALGLFKQCNSFIISLLDCLNNKSTQLLMLSYLLRTYTDDIAYGTELCHSGDSVCEEVINGIHDWIIQLGERQDTSGRFQRYADYYLAEISMFYFKIMRTPDIDMDTIQRYKARIESNMQELLLWISRVYSYFGESCFMLGIIYQYRLQNVKCAMFLYYLCILHSYEDHIHSTFWELKQFAYTNIISYYNLAICVGYDKQYQLSLKLFLRIIRFTKDMSIIDKCKEYVEWLRSKIKRKTCQVCRKKRVKLRSCKGCGLNFYCSVQCQKLDWNVSHRIVCSRYWSNKKFFVDSKSITSLKLKDIDLNNHKETLSKSFIQILKFYS